MIRKLIVLAWVLGACAQEGSDRKDAEVAGLPVLVTPRAADTSELLALRAQLATAATLTAADLDKARALPWRTDLGYDPTKAVNMDLVQASVLKLDVDELAGLERDGFVISERKAYPSFFAAYRDVYSADLPVYVTADSILHAVHRSYDRLLMNLEQQTLRAKLASLLDAMRAALQAGGPAGAAAETRADADLYLAVAASLLTDTVAAPVAGASAVEITRLYDAAKAAQGTAGAVLFGDAHDMIDWSQFAPRGHYKGMTDLERYFRAMMWLGRMELRLIKTEMNGAQTFQRRSLEGALALRALMDTAAMAAWKSVDASLRAFVGEPDSMGPADVEGFLAAVGAVGLGDLSALPDKTLAQALVDGGWGVQRICSQMMVNGTDSTLPLDRSFLLLGQRYVVDSHVFANVVYDRAGKGSIRRMMPDPLDVAYAALGNDQAVALLAPQLAKYPYAPDLEQMRMLVDAHGAEFWGANLYNAWVGAIRALSPVRGEIADPAKAGLPMVAATERWGRRILNAQLASWAELRHDTLLYAKQSYTGIPVCEYPDAYVDPYPAFFKAIADLGRRGRALLSDIGSSSATSAIDRYLGTLVDAADQLQEMAEHQRTGVPHSAESLIFINNAVSMVPMGCTSGPGGWYVDLIYQGEGSPELNTLTPTIADVHTQPADEAGNTVGRILHVGTGKARTMVVTVETCSGPRAYVGPVSSYYEKVTDGFQRLDDAAWITALSGATDVSWMNDLVVR